MAELTPSDARTAGDRRPGHTNDVWIEVEYDQMVTLTPGLKGHVTIRGPKPDPRTGRGRASPRPSGGPQFPSAQPPVASEAVVEIHHRTCAGQDRERRMPSGRGAGHRR